MFAGMLLSADWSGTCVSYLVEAMSFEMLLRNEENDAEVPVASLG